MIFEGGLGESFMKSLILFVIFFGLFQSMYGSLTRKSVPFDLDSEIIELSKELARENSDEDIKVIRRQMSRAYVGFMEQLQQLRIKDNVTQKEFDTFCLQILEYKMQHLELLQRNKLLYEDGHNPRDNHFNSDLLAQLKDVAEVRKFSTDNIPSPVGQPCEMQDWQSVSDDEI